MTLPSIAILHYSAPPVVGGVEAVIDAHARAFIRAGYPVTIVAGQGAADALPEGVQFVELPEMSTQHPDILAASAHLERGACPPEFDELAGRLEASLGPLLAAFDCVIVHNIFTKHFNLPLTVALWRLLDAGRIRHPIAWCHDFTWTSSNSRARVHDGYPWALLRTYRPEMAYVVVSQARRRELAGLYQVATEKIRVVYNGVSAVDVLGIGETGAALAERLHLLDAGLVLLMPVRVTTAKNIEYALQVVAALKRLGAQPLLVLSGPPDPHDAQSMAYYDSLRDLRRELGIENEMRFVFESGPEPGEPYTVPLAAVGDLYRLADVMLMPSHREGFGMPVLEALLAGVPVVASRAVPAAVELAEGAALLFNGNESPADLALRLLAWLNGSALVRMRRHVRRRYTWDAILREDIRPLLPHD